MSHQDGNAQWEHIITKFVYNYCGFRFILLIFRSRSLVRSLARSLSLFLSFIHDLLSKFGVIYVFSSHFSISFYIKLPANSVFCVCNLFYLFKNGIFVFDIYKFNGSKCVHEMRSRIFADGLVWKWFRFRFYLDIILFQLRHIRM